jgi:hypothetical protein
MNEAIRISFGGAEEDLHPFVTVYNPIVLSGALLSQIMRFGLVGSRDGKSRLSGQLKGTRADFTRLILSYGVRIELVGVNA